jgi:hypothetical protein
MKVDKAALPGWQLTTNFNNKKTTIGVFKNISLGNCYKNSKHYEKLFVFFLSTLCSSWCISVRPQANGGDGAPIPREQIISGH